MFDILTSQNRYVPFSTESMPLSAPTRPRRVEQYVAMLARGEPIYPRKRTRAG